MFRFILASIFVLLDLNSYSQTGWDNIDYCGYFIVKSDAKNTSVTKVPACKITSIELAEQLFGLTHKTQKYSDTLLFMTNFITLTFPDGLIIRIDDDHKELFTFNITSDNYSIILTNGKEIKIGMDLDELKTLFPKSYDQRNIIMHRPGEDGKTEMRVFISFIVDNKVIITGSPIILVIGRENRKLEAFRSWVPG